MGDALLEGPDLRTERENLGRFGFSPKLESGAKIFVRPELYELVVQHLARESLPLKTSHVVVEPALDTKVRAARQSFASRARHVQGGGAERDGCRHTLPRCCRGRLEFVCETYFYSCSGSFFASIFLFGPCIHCM